MSITFRNYSGEPFFSRDYIKVRDFLIRINRDTLRAPNFTWGRWQWMIISTYTDNSVLGKLGIWEDGGEIVGFVGFDGKPGYGYFCVSDGYDRLKPEMLSFAEKSLATDGKFMALVDINDRELQQAAVSRGFRPTQDGEQVAVIDIGSDLDYALPEGYRFLSWADREWSVWQYLRVLWRGFNHEGKPETTKEDVERIEGLLPQLDVIPELSVAVVAPDGNYVSYCGMWYLPGDNYAYVEPVATDPDYRMMGLGRAAVLEAVRRCGTLGAKQALVGSSQQFYYSIGFRPYAALTWWEKTAGNAAY